MNRKVYHTKKRPIEPLCSSKYSRKYEIKIGDQWVDPKTNELWEYKVISKFVVKSCHWVKLTD